MRRFLLLIFFVLITTLHADEFDRLMFQSFKERYEAGEIIGVELLEAARAPDVTQVMSQWGHVLLRFVDNDGDWSNDLVLSFIIPDELQDKNFIKLYAKGLTGSYRMHATLATFSSVWQQYLLMQNRPIARYPLATNKVIRDSLFELVMHYEKKQDLPGYTFLSNNCAAGLVNFLKSGGIAVKGTTIFPLLVEGKLANAFALSYPKLTIDEAYTRMMALAKKLGIKSYAKLLKASEWEPDFAEKLLSIASEYEIKLMLIMVPMMKIQDRQKLVEKYNFRSGLSFDQVIGVKELPEEFYELCTTNRCALKRERAIFSIWKKEELFSFYGQMKKELSSFDQPSLVFGSVYENHLALLLRTIYPN